MKRFIVETVDNIKYDLHGKSITDAIKALTALATEHGEDATLDIGQECESYSYSEKEYAYVRLTIRRLENDEEYQKRTAQEAEYLRRQAANDLEAYNRVKKSMEERK